MMTSVKKIYTWKNSVSLYWSQQNFVDRDFIVQNYRDSIIMFVSVWHSNHNKSFTAWKPYVCTRFYFWSQLGIWRNSPRWGELWLVPWLVMTERSEFCNQIPNAKMDFSRICFCASNCFSQASAQKRKACCYVRNLFFSSYLEEKSHFNWVSGIRLKNVNKCYLWGVLLSRLDHRVASI